MYGSRDAAHSWECKYVEVMDGIGFQSGLANPCAFYHPEREIRFVVHGDGFTALGSQTECEWMAEEMRSYFELKVKARLGPKPTDDKSVRILNRIVTWDDQGIMYEGDQRHAEIIVKQLGLEGANSNGTTGGKTSKCLKIKNLCSKDATMYRALTARASYLSQDRSDIKFAVKELASGMAKPTTKNGKISKNRQIFSRQMP